MLLKNLFYICRLSPNEKLVADLDIITKWQEKLSNVNVDNVKPLFNVLDEYEKCIFTDNANTSKTDIMSKVLSNAPLLEGSYVVVPSVIDKNE